MKNISKFSSITLLFFLYACVNAYDFEPLNQDCLDVEVSTKSIDQVTSLATSQVSRYPDEDSIEAYVISSDQEGNFFKKLIAQNRDGTLGFSISLDHTDLYTHYNPGRKIYVNLKNRYVQIKNDALEIGALFTDTFNRETVGRIAYPEYEKMIIKSCDQIEEKILINQQSIASLTDANINTFIEFKDVQFVNDALSSTFYDLALDEGGFASNHTIEDKEGNQLLIRTSAFADYAVQPIPNGSGTIRGVLTKFNGSYQLLARGYADFQLTNPRFEIEVKNNLFFTELADPDNNSAARFIEIYNAESSDVNLNNWSIRRYTNANTELSSILDLSGLTIKSNQTLVIAANALEFERVYGFPPDMDAGTNGPADSNGDDNLELVDSQGLVVDMFGIIGEDGSGTNHEFEDGKAVRKVWVNQANPIYTFGEWDIWNDSGLSGTRKAPQNAPEDFSPGVR